MGCAYKTQQTPWQTSHQEGCMIRLQHIYNFLLSHVVLLSFLDVLQSFYSNFISFFGTNLLTQCLVPVVVFCLFSISQEINIKRSPNTAKLFVHFLWTRRHPMGQSSTWGVPAQARPGGLCPPRWPPVPPLRP